MDSLSGSSFHCLPLVKAEPDSRNNEQFVIPPALPTTTATSHVTEDADRLNCMSTPKPYQISQPKMPSTQLPFPQHTPVNLPYTSFSPNQAYGQVPVSEKSNKPQTSYLSSTMQQPSTSDHAGMSEIARYLVHHELVNSGLSKFDDRPENYLAWKLSFINALEGLSLTPNEELDLLIRWQGPQSSEQVKRVRAVHIVDKRGGPLKSFISTHKTEIAQTTSSTDLPNNKPDINRQCPIHRKPHPLKGVEPSELRAWRNTKCF